MPVNSFENYPMSWKPSLKNTTGPKYLALVRLLEEDIKSGALQPGTKLPPQRELADFLDVNLSTISRAFKIVRAKRATIRVRRKRHICFIGCNDRSVVALRKQR